MKNLNSISILLGGMLLCTICITVYADEPFEYKTGGSVNSVHTASGFIAAGSEDKNVYLFDANGNLKWKKQTDGSVESVCISDGYVAAGSFIVTSENRPHAAENDPGTIITYVDTQDSHIYLFDTSGALKWKHKTSGGVKSVHIYDGYVAAATFSTPSRGGYVYLFDTQGNLKWEFRNYEDLTGEKSGFQSVCISRDWVVAGTSYGHVYFIDINNGELLRKRKTGDTVWDVYCTDNYTAAGSQNGYVYFYDNNSHLKWKEKTDAGVGSVKIYKNYVVVGSDDGYVYLFDINGENLWRHKEGNYPNEHVWTVDISNDGIVVGTTVFTYLIDFDEKIKWKWPNERVGNAVGSVSIDKNCIASGTISSTGTVGFVNIFEVGKEYKKPIPIINLIVLGIAVLAIIVLGGVVYYLGRKGSRRKKRRI